MLGTTVDFLPSHLAVEAEDVASDRPGGRLFFLPGSPGRARILAEHFVEARSFPGQRGLEVHVGRLVQGDRELDVGAVGTGMGCPSLGIVLTELVGLGVRRFLRVGTAGSLQESIPTGHVVVATAAVRDEGASLSFAPPEFPAVSSPRPLQALREAALARPDADAFHFGIVHSKDSLHGREFGAGPLRAENARYLRVLTDLGVLATEMEASHLFVLASALPAGAGRGLAAPESLEAGCALAILGSPDGSSTAERREQALGRVVELSLDAALRLPV